MSYIQRITLMPCMMTARDTVIENVRKNKGLSLNSYKSKEERGF